MIVVNANKVLILQTNNKSLVARTIGYHRNSIDNWAKKHDKKDAKDINGDYAFTVYFNEKLYKKEG